MFNAVTFFCMYIHSGKLVRCTAKYAWSSHVPARCVDIPLGLAQTQVWCLRSLCCVFSRFSRCIHRMSLYMSSSLIKHTGCLLPVTTHKCLLKYVYWGGGIFLSAGLPGGTVNTSVQSSNEITNASGTAGCLMHLQSLAPAVKAEENLKAISIPCSVFWI